MAQRNSAAHAAKLTAAEANVALAVRNACAATARATHAARVAKATSVATVLATRVYVPTKARPYVPAVDMSYAREVVRLARAASLQATLAMRAIRLADAAIKAVKAPVPFFSVPVIEVHTVPEEGFSAWHRAFMAAVHAYVPVATKARTCATTGLSLEQKVMFKALRTVGRRIGSAEAIKPRATMNTPAKRAAITERDTQRYLGRIAALEALAAEQAALSAAEKAAAIADAKVAHLALLSEATKAFRAAQGAEQREWNAALKAHKANKAAHKEIKALERSIMGITPVVQVRVVRPIVAKLVGAHQKDAAHKAKVGIVVNKQCSYPEAAGFRTSPLHPVMAPKTAANAAKREAAEKAAKAVAARKAAKRLSREEWELQKAHRQALKEQYMALRVAKVNRICTEVWYNRGIYVDIFLIRACNDSDHDTRVAAMTELLALRGVAA